MKALLMGIESVFTITTLLYICGGVIFGFIIGALPGLTGNMAIALMVPVTFTMETTQALAFLTAIYCSAIFGGSVSAILLGIPGTISSMATAWDGHPMALQGKSGEALGNATLSSVFGGLFSALALMFFTPILAEQALKFGPAEYFAVAVLGLTCIASLGGGDIIKGLISAVLGLFIATIGMDPQTGFARYTFGSMNLLEGVDLVAALIGLFGVASLLKSADHANDEEEQIRIPDVGSLWIGIKECIRLLPTWIRGSLIGTIVGIIPGTGTNVATFVSYDFEKKISKNPENFGKGEPKGIAAPEAANNGVTGGSLVPLLALGVPGNSTSALFLGAIMIHGLNVGPVLFTDHPEVVNGLFVSFFLANIIMAPVGLFLLRYIKRILSIPEKLMSGMIAAFCVTGVYSLNTNPFDILVMGIFGIIGYAFSKVKMPTGPLIVAMVLGAMTENSLRQAMKISQGSLSFLYKSPITVGVFVLAIISLLFPIITELVNKKRTLKAE